MNTGWLNKDDVVAGLSGAIAGTPQAIVISNVVFEATTKAYLNAKSELASD